MYVSFYLHLSKFIGSAHLCYIYLDSLTSQARLIPREWILSSISITVQACAEDLYETHTHKLYCFFVQNGLRLPLVSLSNH